MSRRRWMLSGAAAAVVISTAVEAIALVAVGLDALSLVVGGLVAATSVSALAFVWRHATSADQRDARRRRAAHEQKERKRHAHTRNVVHKAERRIVGQVEALLWVRDALAGDGPLPPLSTATAAPDLLRELILTIDQKRPTTVLECGSGVSTVVMAARLKTLGGTVVALEHKPEYAAATRELLVERGLDDVATVIDAPIVANRIGDTEWPWYELPTAGLPSGIELMLVDGPPASVGRLARYPALPLLADRLAPAAMIILDDADRTEEATVAQRWQDEYAGLTARYIRLAKGAYVFSYTV